MLSAICAMCLLSQPLWCRAETTDQRPDSWIKLTPSLERGLVITLNGAGQGGVAYSAATGLWGTGYGTDPWVIIKLNPTPSTSRSSLPAPMECEPQLQNYTDSTGKYELICTPMYKFDGITSLQGNTSIHPDLKIEQIQLWVSIKKDGVFIDPEREPIPGAMDPIFTLTWRTVGGVRTATTRIMKKTTQSGTTQLSLDIDDHVNTYGDYATINYVWRVVNTGIPDITPLSTKMYMEQLDSNLEMTYIGSSGAGDVVIVPNTPITLPTKMGLSDAGKIRLKLTSKRGYGPRSSQLRVTVEWS